jgi:MFS family permease
MMTSVYSIVATEFPKQREKYFGYIELCLGLGMSFGPFLSGVLYQYINYLGIFMLLSAILACGCVQAYIVIPSILNQTKE